MPSRWYQVTTAAAVVSLSVIWPTLSLGGEQPDHRGFGGQQRSIEAAAARLDGAPRRAHAQHAQHG